MDRCSAAGTFAPQFCNGAAEVAVSWRRPSGVDALCGCGAVLRLRYFLRQCKRYSILSVPACPRRRPFGRGDLGYV